MCPSASERVSSEPQPFRRLEKRDTTVPLGVAVAGPRRRFDVQRLHYPFEELAQRGTRHPHAVRQAHRPQPREQQSKCVSPVSQFSETALSMARYFDLLEDIPRSKTDRLNLCVPRASAECYVSSHTTFPSRSI